MSGQRSANMTNHAQTVSSSVQDTLRMDDPDFDLAAAAQKLSCKPDHDSVWNAVDILQKQVDEQNAKVKFFENLFNCPTEYLMGFHPDELARRDDLRLMGQQRLHGKDLQRALFEKTGKEHSLEVLTGKSVIKEMPETHYAFAVVLPLESKERLDRQLRQVRAQDQLKALATPIPFKSVVSAKATKDKDTTVEKNRKLSKSPAAPHTSATRPIPAPRPSSSGTKPALKTPAKAGTLRASGSSQKRKRAVVISDEEDEN
ncbi:hypothetical protein BU23DRAFT_573866 [Bimuria novae-zelandiae CBS 107.79]|uniref:Uncharacterized protein n=1 Tax=Bimuria novae-zelandiae CBS 107.79 TaxID=1447943 RepID=A0A6A5URP5_9PLEO|nr:hypothetical protein BU23DRAFT_573866 [Bimuria novae-zelandiae CBS 107.79]